MDRRSQSHSNLAIVLFATPPHPQAEGLTTGQNLSSMLAICRRVGTALHGALPISCWLGYRYLRCNSLLGYTLLLGPFLLLSKRLFSGDVDLLLFLVFLSASLAIGGRL
jgi:hypothetical protein